ncbi:MAG: hypothetical protein QM535_20150 [Limnohabitans sp.]|nr:hypothetical protein [Limnohabitans sp.]
MKNIIKVLFLLFYLSSFAQRDSDTFMLNKIDFVLDSEEEKSVIDYVVTEYIKKDSISSFYNTKGIQPFCKYVDSEFFKRKRPKIKVLPVSLPSNKSFFEFESRSLPNKKNSVTIDLNTYKDFSIETKATSQIHLSDYVTKNEDKSFRDTYYKPFKNFEISSYSKKSNVSIYKEFYSNVSLTISQIDLFRERVFREICFYNTLTINYSNSDNTLKDNFFKIIIYETIRNNGPYMEGEHSYIGNYPDVVMRKISILGDSEKALKYLKTNNIDYKEIDSESFSKENFEKK